jgi:ABC-type branched-subunit amino acid transport system permease subunit
MRTGVDQLRRRVSTGGIWLTIVVAVLLPFVLSVGNNLLFSQICIFSVIALSLTMLTGWAGQVSLGQFGLVAVGALVAVHLGTSLPLPVVMLYGGAITALVAILIGLPALRMPGLFLAVTTLAFAIFMQSAVLATPCFSVPGIHKTLCTGLPDPGYTFLARLRCSASAWPRRSPSPSSRWAFCCCPSSWCASGATRAWRVGSSPCGTTS